jgi:hypothetical protein
MLPGSLKKKIIENIFSVVDFDLPEDDKTDTVLEMLNVLAGRFLTLYFDNEGQFKMELPGILMNNEHKNKDSGNIEMFFNAEGDMMKVIFRPVS